MLVSATRVLRRLRGGAQAHLIEASDGHFYVVKFLNNPQHRRILVNEWIAQVFLRYLQLACPPCAFVDIQRPFLDANPQLYLQAGSHRIGVEPGWHFGSRFPGHPDRLAIYDFLPEHVLGKVDNWREFLGILSFDKWTANADARQAVFFRGRLRDWMPEATHPLQQGFVAMMIDHGYVFNGPFWNLEDAPRHGLYFRPFAYERVRGLDDFQPWLDRIASFPDEVVDEAWRQLPPEWIDGGEAELHALLEQLMKRRAKVADLLLECRRHQPQLFPGWL